MSQILFKPTDNQTAKYTERKTQNDRQKGTDVMWTDLNRQTVRKVCFERETSKFT